jgi:branched-chain amino acid transport system ATP-binding protein
VSDIAPVLQVEGLHKALGSFRLSNITFDVHDSEILGIIGPNGAGKTSLFALLAGNIPVGGGVIRFEGRDITWAPAHERSRAGIARTYQIPKPFTHMTVTDSLKVAALFGGGLEEVECDDWIANLLEFTGMTAVRDTLAGRLPLLMRKRHELARALASRPRLLLIDEVAAGLTDQEVNEFIELVFEIRDGGVTVIWIEHVMKTMRLATDRLLALAGGTVLAVGKADEVIGSEEVRRVYLGQ